MRGKFTVEQPEKNRAFKFINVDSNQNKETIRQDIVERLCSSQGVDVDFCHLQNGVRDISSILTFHIVGQQLTIRDELGEFAAIEFRESEEEEMINIFFKGYSESQPVYSKTGVMEMAFSLLCEYARNKQYMKIGGNAVHNLDYGNVNMASVFSRKNAVDLTSGNTYASRTMLDEKTGELITYL